MYGTAKIMYAYIEKNTPLFNTKEISSLFFPMPKFDKTYLMRALEMLLLPGSTCKVIEEHEEAYEVKTSSYPVDIPLFIEKHFITSVSKTPIKEGERTLPKPSLIEEHLRAIPPLPYIWGGNTLEGTHFVFDHYPLTYSVSPFLYTYLQFRGFDCSGLLYYVTDGYTHRNTSMMLSHYREIKISEIRPLDLIAWKGHVIIILSHNQVIESREYDGIVVSSLHKRLEQIHTYPYKLLRFYE